MFRFGNFLLLLGTVLLVLSLITIPFWKSFDSEFIPSILGVLVAGVALIMVGQALRHSGKRQQLKKGPTFMDYYRLARSKVWPGRYHFEKEGEGRRCAFCGINLVPRGIPAKLGGVIDLSRSETQASKCEECGKLVCPQCAFHKGMEMGIRTFRCPACGGKVR